MSLLDKLAKIEALIMRASSEGERQAAVLAKERILKKQDQLPIEYVITHHNLWKKKLFLALCYQYGLEPYRYKRQKKTTTRVKAYPTLMKDYIWPEYKKYALLLEELVEEIVGNLIHTIQEKETEKNFSESLKLN